MPNGEGEGRGSMRPLPNYFGHLLISYLRRWLVTRGRVGKQYSSPGLLSSVRVGSFTCSSSLRPRPLQSVTPATLPARRRHLRQPRSSWRTCDAVVGTYTPGGLLCAVGGVAPLPVRTASCLRRSTICASNIHQQLTFNFIFK